MTRYEDERFPRCSVYCDYSFGHAGPHSQEAKRWDLATNVALAAEQVYDHLGPGHSEAVYEAAMDIELIIRALEHRRQVPCSIDYKGYSIGFGLIDILVREALVVEIKAVAKLASKDEQQVRKYLAATGLDEGLLINFGNDLEINRIQKGMYEQTPSETS